MNPQEGVAPPKIEEKVGEGVEGVDQNPLEIEVAEVSNEELEQHATSTGSHINQQAEEFLTKGGKRMEESASSMKVSPEVLDSTKQEFGLDTKLQEIQAEADQIEGEAISDIASVTEEPQLEKNVEIKQQTPEEIKQERRSEIIKEIEKEWEERNGPMEEPLTKWKIEENKKKAEFWRKEWDGSTTQMTEKANEFFFDHRGMGEYSVPRRADKILIERFPEYAKKTETRIPDVQESVGVAELRTAEQNPVQEKQNTPPEIREKPAETPKTEPSLEGKKSPKDEFMDALNEDLSAMEQAGRISREQAEDKRINAALIEIGFSDNPKYDALEFSRAGIAGEKELIEIIDRKNAEQELSTAEIIEEGSPVADFINVTESVKHEYSERFQQEITETERLELIQEILSNKRVARYFKSIEPRIKKGLTVEEIIAEDRAKIEEIKRKTGNSRELTLESTLRLVEIVVQRAKESRV